MGVAQVFRVQIVGTVVSVSKKSTLTIFAVDDGTACIDCIRWVLEEENEENRKVPELGASVHVCGILRYPRWVTEDAKVREIVVDEFNVVDDPNAECLFWLEAVELGSSIYKSLSC